MDLAQFTPDRVPLDLLLKLSVYDEDWYVEAPANAALKTMVRSAPAVLQVFYRRLKSDHAAERVHAATALHDIARIEPHAFDPKRLVTELRRLKHIGDRDASKELARAIARSQRVRRAKRYRYGI